jgi:lipoprotein
MKYSVIIASLLLAACTTKVQTVKVFEPIPVQCDLTQVCSDKEYSIETNRDLALAFANTKAELAYCSEHLKSLQACVKRANNILEGKHEKTTVQETSSK